MVSARGQKCSFADCDGTIKHRTNRNNMSRYLYWPLLSTVYDELEEQDQDDDRE
jgi:hypothetical protein